MCVEARDIWVTDTNNNKITVAKPGDTIYVWYKAENTCAVPILWEVFKLFLNDSVVAEKTSGSFFPYGSLEDKFTYVIPSDVSGWIKLGVSSNEDISEQLPIKYTTIQVIPVPPQQSVLNIDSSPRGASVYINGTYQGQTPLTVTVSPGEHEILFKKSGYAEKMIRVTVAPGEIKNVSVTLEEQEFKLNIPEWLPSVAAGAIGLLIGFFAARERR